MAMKKVLKCAVCAAVLLGFCVSCDKNGDSGLYKEETPFNSDDGYDDGTDSLIVDPPDGASFSQYFVDLYVMPSGMSLSDRLEECNTICVTFSGEEIRAYSHEDSLRFIALAKSFGDTSYNRRSVPYSNPAIGSEIRSVSVVCDKDFPGVPAGDNLNDVVVLCSASPYEYIQNGYEELQYGEFRYPEYWNGGYSVDFNEEYVPVEKETGFFGEDGVKIFFKGGSSLEVDLSDGSAQYEKLRKRPVLGAFSRLHYNPSKWWTWFSDIFAVSLLLITVTGIVMLKGPKGLWGRGGIELLAGILIPLLFILL